MATKKQKEDAPEVQIPLLELEENWKEHYNGMPAYKSEDCMPYKTVMVHFAERSDMVAFAKLVKQKIELSTKYIWYPESEIQVRDMQWVSEDPDSEVIDES